MNPYPPHWYRPPPKKPRLSVEATVAIVVVACVVAFIGFVVAVDKDWIKWRTAEEREADRIDSDERDRQYDECVRIKREQYRNVTFSDRRSPTVHAIEDCR